MDKVFFYYAPIILGSDAVPFSGDAQGRPLGVTDTRIHPFGNDFAVEGYLRDPYES